MSESKYRDFLSADELRERDNVLSANIENEFINFVRKEIALHIKKSTIECINDPGYVTIKIYHPLFKTFGNDLTKICEFLETEGGYFVVIDNNIISILWDQNIINLYKNKRKNNLDIVTYAIKNTKIFGILMCHHISPSDTYDKYYVSIYQDSKEIGRSFAFADIIEANIFRYKNLTLKIRSNEDFKDYVAEIVKKSNQDDKLELQFAIYDDLKKDSSIKLEYTIYMGGPLSNLVNDAKDLYRPYLEGADKFILLTIDKNTGLWKQFKWLVGFIPHYGLREGKK
jgi:hypothetical protein